MNEENITPLEKKEQLEDKLEDMSRNYAFYTEKDMKKALREWKLWRKIVKIEAKKKRKKIKTWLKVKKAVDKKYGIGIKQKIKDFFSAIWNGLKKAGSFLVSKAKNIGK